MNKVDEITTQHRWRKLYYEIHREEMLEKSKERYRRKRDEILAKNQERKEAKAEYDHLRNLEQYEKKKKYNAEYYRRKKKCV